MVHCKVERLLLIFATIAVFLAASNAENVLFVGNSYTYVNSLDQVFANLWRSSTYSSIYTAAFANGGWMFWDQMDAARNSTTALYQLLWTSGIPWTYIVWQDQSIVPSCVYGLNSGQKAYYADSTYAIGQLNTMARAQNPPSKSILYQTWGRQSGYTSSFLNFTNYASMQDALTQGYNQYRSFVIANMSSNVTLPQNTITVAPAGEVWRRVFLDGVNAVVPFDSLYLSDGSHPTIFGTYVVACTLWSIITGFSPVGLGYIPAGMNETHTRYLQQTTHTIVSQLTGLTLLSPPTPPPTTPPPTTTTPPTSSSPPTTAQPLPSDSLGPTVVTTTNAASSSATPAATTPSSSPTVATSTLSTYSTAATTLPSDTLGTFGPRNTLSASAAPPTVKPTSTPAPSSSTNDSSNAIPTIYIIAILVVALIVLIVAIIVIVIVILCCKKYGNGPRSRRQTNYDQNSLYTSPR